MAYYVSTFFFCLFMFLCLFSSYFWCNDILCEEILMKQAYVDLNITAAGPKARDVGVATLVNKCKINPRIYFNKKSEL